MLCSANCWRLPPSGPVTLRQSGMAPCGAARLQRSAAPSLWHIERLANSAPGAPLGVRPPDATLSGLCGKLPMAAWLRGGAAVAHSPHVLTGAAAHRRGGGVPGHRQREGVASHGARERARAAACRRAGVPLCPKTVGHRLEQRRCGHHGKRSRGNGKLPGAERAVRMPWPVLRPRPAPPLRRHHGLHRCHGHGLR